jgi:hypothetical protein
MLEGLALSAIGQRRNTREAKLAQHAELYPWKNELFVETFFDTVWTYDFNDECEWNGVWKPPTLSPPLIFNSDTTLPSIGELTHNAYEGSLSYTPGSTDTNVAGTYRTRNLLSDEPAYTPDYRYINTWPTMSAESDFATIIWEPYELAISTIDTFHKSAYLLMVVVDANEAFWAKHWTGSTGPTDAESLEQGNRITIYYDDDGTAEIETANRLIYVPHVKISAGTERWLPTSSTDNIWGKIMDIKDVHYLPNADVVYRRLGSGGSPAVNANPFMVTGGGTGQVTFNNLVTQADSTWLRANLPSGIINDNTNISGVHWDSATLPTVDRMNVDISLAEDAKIFSLSVQMVPLIAVASRYATGDLNNV